MGIIYTELKDTLHPFLDRICIGFYDTYRLKNISLDWYFQASKDQFNVNECRYDGFTLTIDMDKGDSFIFIDDLYDVFVFELFFDNIAGKISDTQWHYKEIKIIKLFDEGVLENNEIITESDIVYRITKRDE